MAGSTEDRENVRFVHELGPQLSVLSIFQGVRPGAAGCMRSQSAGLSDGQIAQRGARVQNSGKSVAEKQNGQNDRQPEQKNFAVQPDAVMLKTFCPQDASHHGNSPHHHQECS